MRIERISFASADTVNKKAKSKTTQNPNKQENNSHNNNSKYIIGGLIGVAALTGMVIAGRKGYLGTKVQKLLGNGEKNIKNTTNPEKTVNTSTKAIKEAPKIRQETTDIIKDGKKVGIEIKSYKENDLICTTTKTFDENGNINKINEKYPSGRSIEIEKSKVNHNNKDYTVWDYFEIPVKGPCKSINFKFDKNNDYTLSYICVYPKDMPEIKQKLAENGVKFGKQLTNSQ